MFRCLPLCAVLLAPLAQAEEAAASLVLHNARIYTVDADQPWAEALYARALIPALAMLDGFAPVYKKFTYVHFP